MLTNEELNAIEKRANAATPGPWEWDGAQADDESVADFGAPWIPQGSTLGNTLIQLADTYEGSPADCAFVAAARDDVPCLVTEVRRLRDALEIIARGTPHDGWIEVAPQFVYEALGQPYPSPAAA